MRFWWLKKNVHQSWLITVICTGFVVGIVASWWMPATNVVGIAIVGIIGTIYCLRCHRTYTILIALICGCCLGLCPGMPDTVQRKMYGVLYGTRQTIQAVVVDDPQLDARGGVALKVDSVIWNNHKMLGVVRVTTTTTLVIKRYDIVMLSGKISPGFGTFAAVINGAVISKAERAQSGDVAGNIRDAFSKKIRLAIPEPQASLGIGYLVGQKSELPSDLSDAFRVAGLTHVVVASGYNLTILVRLAR